MLDAGKKRYINGICTRFVQTGGKEGAYLSTTTGLRSAAYSASARVVSFIVTTVGAAGNAGRTFGAVIYALPTPVAAVKT